MIPKIIHYCWFGGKPIPDHLQKYISDWSQKCPDWEIKLWNEESFDVDQHIFTQTAYQQRKYAFVSDYVRAWALHEFGGVYLDTDVELKHPLDDFLACEAFSGFESINLPFTAVWGAIPYHSLSKEILAYYHNKTYSDQEPPNTSFISDIISEKFKIDRTIDINQSGSDGHHTLHIYASHYFCLDLPVNYATHHFIGSWLEDRNGKKPYKQQLHNKYYLSKLEDDFLLEKRQLKDLAKKINFSQLFLIIRYFVRSIIKKDK